MSLKFSFQSRLNTKSKHESSKYGRKKEKSQYFRTKRKRKEIWIPLQKQGKKPLIVVRLASRRSHLGTEGHFCPLLQKKKKKRRRISPKQSPKKLIHPALHPYLNSSVHFAQFSADLDNIPNMTRS